MRFTWQHRPKKGTALAVPGIPYLTAFRVVVGDVFHRFKFHVVHDFPPDFLRRHALFAAGRGRVFVAHYRAMHGRMAAPAQRYQVHWMVWPALAAGLDVVQLQPLRGVANGAAVAIPPVYFLPQRVCRVRVHRVSSHSRTLLSVP